MPVSSSQVDVVPHMIIRSPCLQAGKIVFSNAKRLLQHGVIPGSSQTRTRESALQESMGPFCIACGSTAPSSTGRRRLLPSEGECRVPAKWREKTSLPGRWRWRVRQILCERPKGDRDCNIEPPASPYAIMRRDRPYRGENSGPGKDDRWRT